MLGLSSGWYPAFSMKPQYAYFGHREHPDRDRERSVAAPKIQASS